MAVTLPSPADIGPISDRGFQSGRAVGPGPENYVGPAIQHLGNSITQEAESLGMDLRRQRRQDSILQGSSADAGYLKERQQLVQDTTSDGDYATQAKRFEEGNNRLIQKWSQGIEDPRARQLWSLDAQKQSVSTSGVIANHVETNVKQQRGVLFEDNLKTYQSVIADPRTDEPTRQRALANAQSTIRAAQNEGVITPEGAQQWGVTYVTGGKVQLAATQVETRDGNKAVAPPQTGSREQHGMQALQGDGLSNVAAAGILGTLNAESRNLDPNAVNKGDGTDGSDSLGIGQWNGNRAQKLQAFAASRGTKWNDLDTQLAFITHEMKADYPQVWAKLQAAKTPEEAAGIVTTEYTKPAGSQNGPGAAMFWSRRRDAAIRLAGGKFEPGSATSPDPYLYTYGKIRDANPDFTPQQVEAVTQRAISARNSFRVADRASLEGVVQDAPAAIQATGGYSGQLPTSQQFTDAYGPQEGAQRYSQFQAAVGVSQTVHDMLTMPAADIQATVDASRATNGGVGAALDAQKAATIQAAAESTLKAREADPASYTLQAFPQIKQAWATAQQSPDGYAGALRMTAAAQTQLGIPADKQALIPKGMAEDVVKAGKDDTKTPADRLGAISQLVLATTDKGQRQAILQQLVKAGMPASIDRSLDAAARGDAAGAQLLFAAATVDPTKLPGEIDAGGWLGSSGTKVKSSDIEAKIQTEILAPGKIGDAVYGLNDGNLDNLERAQNDGVLLKNGVKLEMLHNGGDLNAAVERVSKALYGDLKPISQGQVSIAAPSAVNETQLVDGLDAQKEAARQELSRFGLTNEAKTPQDKQIARMAGMDKERQIQTILDNGVWRNVGDGYGLLDKASGLFVAGPDGKPFVVTADQALKAAVTQTGAEPPAAAPSPGQYQEMKRAGPGGRFRADFGQTPAPAPASAPNIPAAAHAPPQLQPPTQDEAAATRQRTLQIKADELALKAGQSRIYESDIPQ